jgi:ATP phosphoribosyltransferase
VPIKIALPKGRLLRKTAARLQKAEWQLDEYHSEMGFYRPKSRKFPDVLIRVFHEKDIPVQIAMGNYDLGICCLDWIEELLSKYPSSDLIKVRDLLYGEGSLYAAESPLNRDGNSITRIVSEYPNLAEAFALRKRLSRFSIFPVWGAAEAYPPENADIALLVADKQAEIYAFGMKPVDRVLDFSAFLVANRNSWETKNLDKIVTSICDTLPEEGKKVRPSTTTNESEISGPVTVNAADDTSVKMALPDGHQQQQTVDLLNRAGIGIDDYPSETGNRRPKVDIKGVSIKVVRPQDMPLQVANGNFDLAITGRDWLTDHLEQFPSSPVKEYVDLKLRKVRLVAVVHEEIDVTGKGDLQRYIAGREEPFRIASEYVNIADMYARENRLGHYRVIPTWGATEAFLPEDADLLIENTETGRTIARHNLKIIDTLFESTACLIVNTNVLSDASKIERVELIGGKLRAAVGEE